MKTIPKPKTDASKLRHLAEAQLEAKAGHKDAIPNVEAARKLLHELQVYQIELEMQNEELRRSQAETEASMARFTEFFDYAPTSYLTLQRNGTIQEINLTGANLMGLERPDLIGRRLGFFVDAEFKSDFDAFLKGVFTDNARVVCEVKLLNADQRTLFAHLEAIADASGQFCRMSLVDITYRKRMEDALHENDMIFRMITENIGDHIAILDADGRRIYNSPSYRQIFGDEWLEIGSDSFREIHPEDRDRIKALFRKTVATGVGERAEFRFLLSDGSVRYIESEGNAIHDASGNVSKVLVVSRDVTERKQAEDALIESEQHLRSIFENAAIGIAQVSIAGKFLQINQEFCRIIGYTREEVLSQGFTFQQIAFPEDIESDLALVNKLLNGDDDNFDIEKRFIRKDGRIVWVHLSVHLFRSVAREPLYFISAVQDISERKNMEQQLRRLSYFDTLTGLPNRALLNDRIQHALTLAKRDKERMALMYLDLDEFKPVNDTFGHDAGDHLLKEAAIRMQYCVRESDTLARIGGDEFVVLLPTIKTDEDAMVVAEKILDALDQPFEYAGHSLHISSSIGIAVYPEDGNEDEVLLKNADTAMCYAKKKGHNNVQIYQHGMQVSGS